MKFKHLAGLIIILGNFSMNEVYCTKPIDLELKVLSHGKIKKKCSFGSPYFPSRMAPLKYNYSEEET